MRTNTYKMASNVVVDLLECLVLLLADLEATKILWYHGPARSGLQPFRAKIKARTYGSNELACLKKKERKKKEDEQFGDFADSSFSRSRWFLATLTVPLGMEHRIMKVTSL